MEYCFVQILPLIQKYKVVHLNRTDARLANNGQPLEVQKLRCRVNFSALRFTSQIEELGRKVIRLLKQNGPFLVLHLRYEMDMLAFSGCTQGCNSDEVEELTRMRYEISTWFCYVCRVNSNFCYHNGVLIAVSFGLIYCLLADMLILGGKKKSSILI